MSSPIETKRIRDHLQIEAPTAELPVGTTDDNGDILTVVEGAWAKAAAPSAELPVVTADDNGDILTVVEGAWAKAAAPGGGLLVETTYLYVGDYERYFVSTIDADVIVNAYKAGQSVVIHFPRDDTADGYAYRNVYANLVGYAPEERHEDTDLVDDEVFALAYTDSAGIYTNITAVSRSVDNKLMFRIYVD